MRLTEIAKQVLEHNKSKIDFERLIIKNLICRSVTERIPPEPISMLQSRGLSLRMYGHRISSHSQSTIDIISCAT